MTLRESDDSQMSVSMLIAAAEGDDLDLLKANSITLLHTINTFLQFSYPQTKHMICINF